MSKFNFKENYNQLLKGFSDELDISPTKYKQAEERYSSIGEWLKNGNYEDIDLSKIYPQGSFRLGTVVRPLKDGKEADYDIDLVCEFDTEKNKVEADKIKKVIGDRLKENETYKKMLSKEGKRCWTINYAEENDIGFHVDILPSTKEDILEINKIVKSNIPLEVAEKSIAITHKNFLEDYSWFSSNPKGYALWFEEQNKVIFQRIQKAQKGQIFESHREHFAQIDDVPDQLVKTPLQRAIQILKRHRDMRFINGVDASDKPISMIITTLTSQLYGNEEDVFTALKNIIFRLEEDSKLLDFQNFSELQKSVRFSDFIRKNSDGTWYIGNPVNPYENFADKWHENNNKKAIAFFKWVSWVRKDMIDILDMADEQEIRKTMTKNFGERVVENTAKQVGWTLPLFTVGSNIKPPHINIVKPSKPWGN